MGPPGKYERRTIPSRGTDTCHKHTHTHSGTGTQAPAAHSVVTLTRDEAALQLHGQQLTGAQQQGVAVPAMGPRREAYATAKQGLLAWLWVALHPPLKQLRGGVCTSPSAHVVETLVAAKHQGI